MRSNLNIFMWVEFIAIDDLGLKIFELHTCPASIGIHRDQP